MLTYQKKETTHSRIDQPTKIMYDLRFRGSFLRNDRIREKFFVFLICLSLLVLSLDNKTIQTLFAKKESAFVITLSGEDHRLPKVLELFEKYTNRRLHPFYGINGNAQFKKRLHQNLTVGQSGLRETMKMFFNMTIRENYDQVMVFQDDAIPHKNFTYLYEHLPQQCAEADVLLLGASIWHQRHSEWPIGSCFDADRLTFGAYGLLVKKSAFRPILYWLDRVTYITFDHIYRYLQQSGLTVRVAYPPFLIIMDVSHKSLINNRRKKIQFNVEKRAKIHDWHLENYPLATILPREAS